MPSQIQFDELQKENLKISTQLEEIKKQLQISEKKIISLNEKISNLLSIINKKNETKKTFDNINKGCSPNMEEYYQEQSKLNKM